MLSVLASPLLYCYFTIRQYFNIVNIKLFNSHILSTFLCTASLFYYSIELHHQLVGHYVLISRWFILVLVPLLYGVMHYFFTSDLALSLESKIDAQKSRLPKHLIIFCTILFLIFPIKFFIKVIFA